MAQINNCVQEISFEQFYENTKDVIDPTVYIIKPWVEFLKSNVKGTPIALEISSDTQKIYTYGFLIKKAGIKMYCSPFEGWNTPYIGLYSNKEIKDYPEAIKSIYRYLRKEKRIKYFEVTDKNIDPTSLKGKKIKYNLIKNMHYDLHSSEDDLFEKLPRSLKKKIRNYNNQGYSVVKDEPSDAFAELYHKQLLEVFALQKLKPFYGPEKTKSLFDAFKDYKDNILCLKSINSSDGSDIGTAIYLHYKDFAVTFGSASYTSQKKSNMNHVVRWGAIKYLKKSGVTFFDFGGYNPYKNLFQPDISLIPCIHMSSIPLLHFFKVVAKKMIGLRRKIFKK